MKILNLVLSEYAQDPAVELTAFCRQVEELARWPNQLQELRTVVAGDTIYFLALIVEPRPPGAAAPAEDLVHAGSRAPSLADFGIDLPQERRRLAETQRAAGGEVYSSAATTAEKPLAELVSDLHRTGQTGRGSDTPTRPYYSQAGG